MRVILAVTLIVVFPNYLLAQPIDMKKLFSCQNGVLPQSALVKTVVSKSESSPDGTTSTSAYSKYSQTKDKCFKITDSELVYLIDKDQAIYKVYTEEYFNPWIMIDFNKSKAPVNGFKGTVKGVSVYTYKDGKGLPHKIPYMIVIK